MSGLRQLPLPPPGGTPKASRRVCWPNGTEPLPWTCLSVAPILWATHWCPSTSERGARTKGRSVPCWEQRCPRCPYPRQFPPQRILTFSCLSPQGQLTTCLLPGHVAGDVQSHRAFQGTWRGAVLLLSRCHLGRTAGVVLVDLSHTPPDDLPMPHDHVADLEVMWRPYLPTDEARATWTPLPEREPGEEG